MMKKRRPVIDMGTYRSTGKRRTADIRRRARRGSFDRRSGGDRRDSYSIDYFAKGGIERRSHKGDRRKNPERREQWIRVTDWSSVFIGGFDDDVHLS